MTAFLWLACTAKDLPPHTGESDDSAFVDTRTEWEKVGDSFGVMTTIAGKGDIPTKGYDGWDDSYEGGDPLDAELSRPHMTMSDAAGVLYIADKDAHAIRAIEGGVISTLVDTGLSSPNGLWAQPDGTLYIHDMGNNRIAKRTPAGEVSTFFELPSSGTGRGLWVSPDADLAYISCGSTLRKWTVDEGVSTLATGFSSLGNVAVDPDGLVVATDRGGHKVTRIEADGSKTVIAGNGTTSGGGDGDLAVDVGLAQVRGIWFHPLGGYFLATHEGGQLGYVDTEGVWHLMLDGDDEHSHGGDDEHWSTPGKKLSEPRAVVMNAHGDLVITENDAGFIRMIEALE
jgi:hypothetical protein